MRKLLLILIVLIVFLALWSKLPQLTLNRSVQPTIKVVTEESVTISDVKEVGPSVVTVEEESAQSDSGSQSFNFGPFQIFGIPDQQQNQPTAIGSGFIVSADGLVVTSKHVVADVGSKYNVVISDNKKYTVQNIYRDPLNDIAILKIDPNQNSGQTLQPAKLGNSSKLQVGQFVVAIGTALGQFNNTVTTGVISGLGRSVTAGDELQGYVENLNDVIQTDAAINPGNSGGPLVDSSGEVIGINTAIAQNGQNIGFALPVNILKSSINNFNQTGQFNRAYLGVAYNIISKDVALMNNVAQGAYVQTVVPSSPAETAGIQQGDIITKFDGQAVDQNNELSVLIAKKKTGDSVDITVWRDGKTLDLKVVLVTAPNQ